MSEIGGIRVQGLLKYLPEFQWNPTLLTPVKSKGIDSRFHVVLTPYSDVTENWKKRFGVNTKTSLNEQFNLKRKKNKLSIIDRVAFIPKEIIAYPDPMIGWYEHAIRIGTELLKTENFDAIISSSMPMTCHLIAKHFSEKYQIPWIADFRDLWTQNPYEAHFRLRKYFEQKLELKTIKQASALTTVSEPLAKTLAELHNDKSVYSILNGFDPTIVYSNSLSKKFSIVYTGTLYHGKRDPTLLISAIKELCDKHFISFADIELNFYGGNDAWLQEVVEKYHLESIFHHFGQVSRDIAIKEQYNAQILLLLTWDNPSEKGVYTGKLFDYLSARRPILSLGFNEGGVVKDLLDQTQAGVHVSNEAELQDYLLNAYSEYKERGSVQYRGIDAEVMKYSHLEMARQFAKVLEDVVK